MFIYFVERTWVGEGHIKRERETERDREPKAGSRLCTVSTEPNAGLKLTKLGDHDLSQSQTLKWLSHPGTPIDKDFKPPIINIFKYLKETKSKTLKENMKI